MADDRQYHLQFDSNAASSVDQYLEYRRVVGEDDGGKLMTPEEYEKYKKTVVARRITNRLFVSWTGPSGMDCKLIGPETVCFCTHRYKQHKTDFEVIPTDRPILLPCRVQGCRCKAYHYVPMNGGQPIRCRCKHFSEDHNKTRPYKCSKSCGCGGFYSSFTCSCGEPTHAHWTIVETKDERIDRGHPVGKPVPYVAMGGITGFSSLADAYERLDPSGIGALPEAMMNEEIGPSDHPFLRVHRKQLEPVGASKMSRDMERRPEESDMDYFERQYQNRLKAERTRARQRPAVKNTRGPPALQK